ncbi:MAG: hypothetical protein ED556_06720 [Winogradskyella sp.]|uniref:DUF6452 family protein n=1 Tax=Winogradskyella sp. TaxID=1883156 RepID=UPI000F3E3638|nr:DUF6452 family protein [Winogradskyella sp.]RNC87112.1 MAG: hypothetical protein ED556_06720 [Winogradskyella sp.]
MNKSKIVYRIHTSILIVLGFITLQTCERDDICAEGTPTTPRLLIEFFDATDTETVKSVTRLSVYAADLVTDDMGTITLPEAADSTTLIFNSNANSIELPLIIGDEGVAGSTRYFFERDTNLRLDGDTGTDSNIDIIDITYTPEFVYVSRACGFKSIFNGLQVTTNGDGSDTDEWIISIAFNGTTEGSITVENEDATHVQIFH